MCTHHDGLRELRLRGTPRGGSFGVEEEGKEDEEDEEEDDEDEELMSGRFGILTFMRALPLRYVK